MLNYMTPILDALNDGTVIRKAVKVLVLLFAVFGCLAAVVLMIVVLKASFEAESPVATIGGILLCLFIVAATVSGVQVCLYRARTIEELGPSPFTVVPIVAILIRLAGELGAVSISILAAGLCLAVWLGGPVSQVAGLLGPAEFGDAAGGSFLVGMFMLFGGLAYAAFVLILSYFFAEILVVTVDMARSLRTLVGASGSALPAARPAARPAPAAPRPTPPPAAVPARPPVAAPAAAAPLPQPRPAPRVPPHCPACGQPNEPDSVFCAECGARL